jgi:Hypothetical protein (DUF2513)
MKRDMDLVRELLLKLEAEPLDGNLWSLNPDDLGIRDRARGNLLSSRAAHRWRLLDAERGLSGHFVARRLTWAGHDFLDSVRDSKVWRTTKDRVKAAGGFTIEILASVAEKVIEENIAQLLGATLGG